MQDWPHLSHLQLADDKFAYSSTVDATLGVEVYQNILRDGLIRGPPGTPLAQNTVFGWILSGTIAPRNAEAPASVFHLRAEEPPSVSLQKFWEIEEIPSKPIRSPEDEACENLFIKSTTRNAHGRFIVRLPFHQRTVIAGSKEIARASLLRAIRCREENPELDMAYRKFMSEFQSLGHMRISPLAAREQAQYYLPHHAVLRRGQTAKIRVVFNASQKGYNGLSLNDLLMPGPKLQSDIGIVMTNWRFHAFVFTADIVKMFRQILVHPDDAQWQHLLWQKSRNSPIIDLQATTVTYGTACAPFLAIRTLLQLAFEGASRFPHAAEILRNQIYVDDIFSGAHSLETALARSTELVQLLDTAGMKLDKWAANDPRLIGGTPAEGKNVAVKLDETISTLGLLWNPSTDNFSFSIALNPTLV